MISLIIRVQNRCIRARYAPDDQLDHPAPFGGPQEISLDAFSGLPSETYIDIRFVVPWAGTDFPPESSDAVVLKAYEFDD